MNLIISPKSEFLSFDFMITAGWYGDAIAGSGNDQSGRRIK